MDYKDDLTIPCSLVNQFHLQIQYCECTTCKQAKEASEK